MSRKLAEIEAEALQFDEDAGTIPARELLQRMKSGIARKRRNR